MLTSEIPVAATIYPTPPLNAGRRGNRQEIEWRLLTGCVMLLQISALKTEKWTRKWIPTSDEFLSAVVVISLITSYPASAMPSSGLEPETSPLPRECSTAELQGQF